MTFFLIVRNMDGNRTMIIAVFAIISTLIITIISTYSTILTQAIEQAEAQAFNITEQKAYTTDVNVHFKTPCISVIVFTYCW